MGDFFIGIFLLALLGVSIYILITLGLRFAPLIMRENFKSSSFEKTAGIYPVSVDKAILNDYPLIGKNEPSNDSYNDIWKDYPVFSLGSYKQITNNLRYHKNPDNGTCIRADFCGALYRNKKTKSNVIKPLPLAEEGQGARVGYFRTEPNELYFSIPTNQNILY
jgi:hypothetical protein